MRQRILSWFGNNLDFFHWGAFNNWLVNRRQNIIRLWRDHPRIGGGILIFIILIGVLFGTFFWNLAPRNPWSSEKQIFEIRFGASLHQISQLLEQTGIIRNHLAFELYVRLNPHKRLLKAGYYQIGPGMSVSHLVKVLGRGTPEQITVTIPEGYTIDEIADLLAAKGLVRRERFLDLASNPGFVNKVLPDFDLHGSAQGFLFPDTYVLRLQAGEAEIITTMLHRFERIFQAQMGRMDAQKSRYLVIMASIIEKEARIPTDRPIISGVFQNRLRLGYPLQSCATVQYALHARKAKLSYLDLQVHSPYNTYLHFGLPPGPISNPGLASLKAAAFPAQVAFLYFVAQGDGSHIFSRTYSEHLAAQHKIQSKYWFR